MHEHIVPRALIRAFLRRNGGVLHWHAVYMFLKQEGLDPETAGAVISRAMGERFLLEDAAGNVRVAPPRMSWPLFWLYALGLGFAVLAIGWLIGMAVWS